MVVYRNINLFEIVHNWKYRNGFPVRGPAFGFIFDKIRAASQGGKSANGKKAESALSPIVPTAVACGMILTVQINIATRRFP